MAYIKFGDPYMICQTAKLKWPPPNILVIQYYNAAMKLNIFQQIIVEFHNCKLIHLEQFQYIVYAWSYTLQVIHSFWHSTVNKYTS